MHTRELLCNFWKIQKFCEILPVGDWRLLAPNQVDFLAQCACGKARCKFEQPTSLRTCFEKSWTLKNINFLKSSPGRAEVQFFEETPCKPTSVCFTSLTVWLVPTGSACQTWGKLWKSSDLLLDPNTRFWTQLLGQCINPEVLYTFQHATTLGTSFDSSWTCIGHCISLRFHRDENWESEKKVISTCWKPVETPSLNSQ